MVLVCSCIQRSFWIFLHHSLGERSYAVKCCTKFEWLYTAATVTCWCEKGWLEWSCPGSSMEQLSHHAFFETATRAI